MRMSQDAVERERYESRLKFRRDMNQLHADAASATERGRKMGREEGSFQGEIKAFQFVLKQTQTPQQDLDKMSVEELHRLADELRQQVGRLSEQKNPAK